MAYKELTVDEYLEDPKIFTDMPCLCSSNPMVEKNRSNPLSKWKAESFRDKLIGITRYKDGPIRWVYKAYRGIQMYSDDRCFYYVKGN